MAWIKVIQEHEAEGELLDAYHRMREVNIAYNDEMTRNAPAGAPQPHPVTPPELSSLNPLSMLYGRQFMMQVMRGDSRVTPAEREMIATVTSMANNCRY
jgi:hypothetical protein